MYTSVQCPKHSYSHWDAREEALGIEERLLGRRSFPKFSASNLVEMVLVAVKIPDIALGGSVPLELSSFLLPSQWNLIVTHIQDAHRDGTFWKVRTLNILLFGGSQVLSVVDDAILFNTDLIVVTADAAYLDRTNTAELLPKNPSDSGGRLSRSTSRAKSAAGTSGDNYVGMTDNPLSNTSTPTSSTGSKRLMAITVPDTAGPGSVLTVSAPDGTLLSVVVPHNAEPGANITVQY
eukprot:gene28116-33949_t